MLIAVILRAQLVLRSSYDGQVYHSFSLPQNDGPSYRFLRWSECSNSRTLQETDQPITQSPLRILLATDETIRVFEVDNPRWKVVINGASSNLGKVTDVTFGANVDEILVLSDFGVKVTLWSLATSRGVEIRDPKSTKRCYDYRPRSKHLAILTRPAAHDTLMLLTPTTHEVVRSVELPTVDAQGIRWSPDGRWLAIWDATSGGYNILVYTADGNLFRTYNGGQTPHNIGLGIKSIAWHPNADVLAVGDYNEQITLLAKDKVRRGRPSPHAY